MFQKPVRFKRLVPLLIALFFLSLFSNLQRRSSWFEQWAYTLVYPFQVTADWISGGIGNLWHHYFFLVGAAVENERLQKTIQELHTKLVAMDEVQGENTRLHEILQLQEVLAPKGVAARVIAFDPRAELKSITIDKGSADGVAPNLPVMATAGLVGRVGPVSSRTSQVLLLLDPNSVVDVILSRSRVRALLVGASQKTELRPGFLLTELEYLRRMSDIQPGDEVVTSGLDTLYPKDLVVGIVGEIFPEKYGIFQKATVIPHVDFSQLEEVLVLKR